MIFHNDGLGLLTRWIGEGLVQLQHDAPISQSSSGISSKCTILDYTTLCQPLVSSDYLFLDASLSITNVLGISVTTLPTADSRYRKPSPRLCPGINIDISPEMSAQSAQ